MKGNKKLGFSLILSLFFHINFVLLLIFWKSDREKLKKPLVKVKWVEFIPPRSDDKQPAQIVDQEKNVKKSIPEKDYRLSRSHRDALKETRAKKKGDFKNTKNKWRNSQELQNLKAEKPEKSLNNLKLGFFEPKTFVKKALFSGKSGKLNHSESPLEKNSGSLEKETSFSRSELSQTDDYLKDVALGSRTLLRTREFVYYSYYSRMKKKLKHYWEPKVKVKMRKAFSQGRRIAGVSDRITRLVIVLNRSGELTKVQVKNSSGFRELDEAGMESFREASPFPNPPKGLVDEFGEVKIHWDFVLETDTR